MRKKSSRIKVRRRWLRHPATRVKQSAKRYSRRKTKRNLKKILKEELK